MTDYSTMTKNDLIRAYTNKKIEYAKIRSEWLDAFELDNKPLLDEIAIIRDYLKIHSTV